jgi:Planctomycete cytochrome C
MTKMRWSAAILTACSMMGAQAPVEVDVARDIQPLLREHCLECHGPSQQMKGLRLDRRRDALPNRVGANGARIIPGDSGRSVLFRRLASTETGPQMPPAGPLPERHIKLFQAWIDRGAQWPYELSGDTSSVPPNPAVEKMRMALRAGKREQLPRAAPRIAQGKSGISERPRTGWMDAPHVCSALRQSGRLSVAYRRRGRCEHAKRCRRNRVDIRSR